MRYNADASGALPCIGANDPLRAQLDGLTNELQQNAATLDVRLLQMARSDLRKVRSELDNPVPPNQPPIAKIEALKAALDEAIKQIDALAATGGGSPSDVSKNPALTVDYWRIGQSRDPGGLPFQYLKDNGCLGRTPPDTKCDGVYSSAVALADRIFLIDRVVSVLNAPDRQKILEEAKSREERWHSYLYDTQFQYWWELAFNRMVEESCPAFMRWDCTKVRTDPYGNELGFRQPPDRKLILLHPDIGVEYLHNEPGGQRVKAAIVFQWFGFQHWSWQGTKATNLLGISLVSTVADTSVSRHVGTGLLFHWQKYQLALTSRPGEIGVAINLGLIDRLGTVNQSWAKQLKAPLGQ